MLFCTVQLFSETPPRDPYVHKFSMWGKLENDNFKKLAVYMGFTNGLYIGLYGGGHCCPAGSAKCRMETDAGRDAAESLKWFFIASIGLNGVGVVDLAAFYDFNFKSCR